MENKINIACFKEGSRTAEVKGIWQCDYGQILRIQGLNLPSAVEIHFSLDEHGGEAARRIGVTKDGVTDVPIPDTMLENESAYGDSYYFFAYIYLSDEESGNTEYKIRAKVSTRSKPEGFVSGGNDTFAEILKTVNEIAEDKVDIPAPAKVGQVLSVKATDESGKPTEFEATDQGGGVSDEKIAEAVGTYMEAHPIEESDPTVPDWAKNPEKPSYTAEEVGADAAGTAESKVSVHNTATDSHNDIRELISGMTQRLNALADSDDTTLDQMSEVVAYIKSNKSLIDAITTSKVNVSDIIDNLTTNMSNKPLSAAQGVVLKKLIDEITTVELDETLTDNTKAAPAGMVGELKSDLVELSKSVDNSVYTDFVDGEGWNGTVGEKIKTSLYELVSKMSLVNARVGDKFRLVTYGVGGWANRYYELDENLIVLYVHTGSGPLNGVIEISNESTRYLAINKGNRFDFEFYRYNDIDQNKADIAQNKADIATKISYHYEKGETIGEIKDGLFNINTKTIEATGNIYRHIELDVNLLDNLFLTGVSHYDASSYPFVVFVDANGNVLDIIKGDSKDAKFIDYNIIIKNQDVKKLYINGSNTFIGAYNAKKVDVYERIDGAASVAATSLSKVADATWYNEKVAEAVIDEQKKNPFVWRSFDKGVVVFTFDDSLSDIDLVESLSEEYGVPVCFSSIPSKMNNVTTATGTNKKVHEVLTIAEEHGNEVLCHSSVALSETSTDEEIYANFVTNKKLLEEYGYSVRGIIEAGSGGGELSFDTKRSEKYLRVMYEYSDRYGRNLGMPQYDTGRTYINRNTQNNHNVVDACERNKTLLIFVTHSITDEGTSSINTSESILRDLMAYVKTKDVYLLTFKGVYDMFRSSELENKINQLLN